MRPYTFYLYEGGRDMPSFEFLYCNSEEDAGQTAERLLTKESALVAVQIFNGGDWRKTLYRSQRSTERLDDVVAKVSVS